jgi:hypothetical protein
MPQCAAAETVVKEVDRHSHRDESNAPEWRQLARTVQIPTFEQ